MEQPTDNPGVDSNPGSDATTAPHRHAGQRQAELHAQGQIRPRRNRSRRRRSRDGWPASTLDHDPARGAAFMKTLSCPWLHRVEQQHRRCSTARPAGDRGERHAHLYTEARSVGTGDGHRASSVTAEGRRTATDGFDTSDDPRRLFTITVLPPPHRSRSSGVDAWMTTSTSNRKFDLKAQVLQERRGRGSEGDHESRRRPGQLVQQGGDTQIQPLIPATSFAFTTTDTLSVKLCGQARV